MEKMAFFVFCLVVTMATLGLKVDASCSNTISLERFDIIDKATGKTLDWLPLAAEKHLNVKVAVRVTQTLTDSASYSATLRLKAKVNHVFGSMTKDISCPKEIPSCEFRQMSCSQVQSYLGVSHIGCPLPSSIYKADVTNIKPIGDLTVHIQPSWLKSLVKTVEVTGYVDIWDDTTGERLACIQKTIRFYKDY